MKLATLVLISTSLFGSLNEKKKDIFFSANHMNFNLNKCVAVKDQKMQSESYYELNLKIKHNCKTLLHYETSMECKSVVIDSGKLVQKPSFKPVWKKGQRKLVDIQEDKTRILAWDSKGNVIEKVFAENGSNIFDSLERICFGKAF